MRIKQALLFWFFWLLVTPAFAACNATVPYVFTNGAVADATQVNANYNAITSGMSTNCAGSGVNSDITSLNALSTPLTPSQGGSAVYYGGTSGGTANAQTIASTTPTGFVLFPGQTIQFIPGSTNTGAMTLAVNAGVATNVYKQTPAGVVPLAGGEVVTGATTSATYDGTEFVLGAYNVWADGPATSVASATTTDIGAGASHNISITGTTTITSLGSSASVSLPRYDVCFSGALTLTYNATSLILPGSATITTAAGDCMVARYGGSGNWTVESYSRKTGLPLVAPAAVGVGYGQSWQNPSRGIGTTYTNSTGVPIQVAASVIVGNNGNSYLVVGGVNVAHVSERAQALRN